MKMIALSKGHGDGALSERRSGLYRALAYEQTRKMEPWKETFTFAKTSIRSIFRTPGLARREDLCDYER